MGLSLWFFLSIYTFLPLNFNTSLIYELGVLKTYAEPLLFSVPEDSPVYKDAVRLLNLFKNILPIANDNIPKDSIIREFIGGSCFKD